MKLKTKIAAALGALALAAAPAAALAGQPEHPGSNGKGHEKNNPTPGPKASLPQKAKAYGVYCKDQSRKHVKGEKGTPFSQCVTAMAKAANHEKMNPKRACKEMSRKHVKGEKGTPFSRCVVAAAQLHKEQQEDDGQDDGSSS
jgi:hypothetical protein